MKEMLNKYVLTGGKFIPEIHLRHPSFTYSACGRYTKNKDRI